MEKLKRYDLNCNIFDVYDYDGLSMQELLCQFYTKINECVDFSNSTLNLCSWLVNEGLKEEVAEKLTTWLTDGTLNEVINVSLFNELNSKINKSVNDINRLSNYPNQFLNDYKGICVRTWVEGSLYTERFRQGLIDLVEETNANSIALTTNSYQSTSSSNNPFAREPITINEIEDYIMFLKENNLRILFKPHVEIDVVPYQWRGNINPSDIDEWFIRYKDKMVEYAKLCEKYKVECLSIGSEYKTLTSNHLDKWIDLIKEIRKVYNGFLTYGANLNNDERDEVHQIDFWKNLDFIGVDFYVEGIDNGTYDEHCNSLYHSKNHKNIVLLMDSLSLKHNKPILLTEYGKSLDNSTIENRNNYIKSIHDILLNKKYTLGGFIWCFDQLPTTWFETDTDLKEIFKSRNYKNKTLDNIGYYRTVKSSTSTNNYALFTTYKINRTYVDSSTTFKIKYKGNTSSSKEKSCDLKIRISTHDNVNSPTIQCEYIGNIEKSDIQYIHEGDYIKFYVKVDNYTQVFYKQEITPDYGLFKVYEYQPLTSVDGIQANQHNEIFKDTNSSVIALTNNMKIYTGKFTGSMSGGVINHEVTLPSSLTECMAVLVNVNYINGGNSYDVVAHGQFIGSNKIKINGKHLTVNGGYSFEISYIVIGK